MFNLHVIPYRPNAAGQVHSDCQEEVLQHYRDLVFYHTPQKHRKG